MKFEYKLLFSAVAVRLVWSPSLLRDRKWPRLTKYTHSRVVICLRLEGNLVFNLILTDSEVEALSETRHRVRECCNCCSPQPVVCACRLSPCGVIIAGHLLTSLTDACQVYRSLLTLLLAAFANSRYSEVPCTCTDLQNMGLDRPGSDIAET